MKKARLQNISETILQRLEKKKNIQEEQAYIYFDGIVDVLQGEDRLTVSGEENALSNCINEIWAYRNLDDFSKETAFLLGSVWGAMKVEERKRERREEAADIEMLGKKYHTYVWLLQAMEENPGINHKDLARRGKKTPSEMSQLISRLEPDGLFAYNRIGREKYYYIQERGRKVYKAVLKENTEIRQRNKWLEVRSVSEISTNPLIENQIVQHCQGRHTAVEFPGYEKAYVIKEQIDNEIPVLHRVENIFSRVPDLYCTALIKRFKKDVFLRNLSVTPCLSNSNMIYEDASADCISENVTCINKC